MTKPLLECIQDFKAHGWTLAASGNFSLVTSRHPLSLMITPSGLNKAEVTAEQMVAIDALGNKVSSGPLLPSDESLIHIAIAAHTDANAILHVHSIANTVLSGSRGIGFYLEGYEMLKGLAGVKTHDHREWVPIIENSQEMKQVSNEIGGLFAKYSNLHGFLLRKHGIYTWGKTLQQAVRHLEVFEFLFEIEVYSQPLMNTEKGMIKKYGLSSRSKKR